MANVYFNLPVDMSNPQIFYGSYVEATSTYIYITDGYLEGLYVGSFTYNNQSLSGGTITAYYQTIGGTVDYFAEDLNLSALTVQTYLDNGDAAGLQQYALAGNDAILGSIFDDVLIAYSGNDLILGSSGNDIILGGNGSDIVYGDYGDDVLSGGKGADFLIGGSGIDLLKGGLGDDSISGSSNIDYLKGGGGSDILVGGSGDDTLNGGSGKDFLDGGTGNDLYIVSGVENARDIYFDSGIDGTEVDILDASKVGTLNLPKTFDSGNGIEIIFGAPGGTIISGNSKGVNWDFNDIDLININKLKGNIGPDNIIGSDGDDQIVGITGKDSLFGGLGDDTLKGGKGADLLLGDTGDDILKGGLGLDTLEGGSGNDTLTGGIGSDDFIFNSTQTSGDLITDFDRAEGDQLLLISGNGTNEFQWGYQSTGATQANIFGTITSDFLLEATNKGALLDAVSNAAGSLFGSTIASGVSSVGYFFGLTAANGGLFYIIANQHTQTASVVTTFSTVTVAILEGITGLGTGVNQIAESDIILF